MSAPSASALKLVQLSDCHLPSDPAARYRGLDAWHSLQELLPAVRKRQADALLLSGDVSEDAGAPAYARAAALLKTAGVPVLALPGNHDEPALMQDHFPDGPWSGPLFRETKNWLLVLLDSTAPGEIGGVLTGEELGELAAGLGRSGAKHVLVALHHQPVPVGSPWIDKYALADADHLLDLLEKDGRVRCVTWGHVHQEFDAEQRGMRLLGAPSSVSNSLPGRDKFTLDTGGPAFRWLDLDPDGGVETGLVRP